MKLSSCSISSAFTFDGHSCRVWVSRFRTLSRLEGETDRMIYRRLLCTALAVTAALAASAQSQAIPAGTPPGPYERSVVAAYPPYVPMQRVSGVIHVTGHGSAKIPWMKPLLAAWEKDLQRFQPGLTLEYRMDGTSAAVPSLWNGVGDIAILGEEIDPVAVKTFERVKHHPPLVIQLFNGSVDVRNIDYAQMFFVHKSNPLNELSLEELDGIFGEEHLRGGHNIRTWDQLGIRGTRAGKAIEPHGWRIDDSFGYFLEQALLDGSHRWNCRLHQYVHIYKADGTIYDHGKQILDNLAKDPNGIAVSNIRYANADVKPLAISVKPGGPYVKVSKESLIDGSYPLLRVIPAVIDREPGMPVEPKLSEFLRYLLSREGQKVLIDDGRYLPLSVKDAAIERRKLD